MFEFDFATFDLEVFCRFIGLLGVAIYVLSFIALSLGKLSSKGALYFTMVLVASSCILASLWADFNLSSALIQCFYIVISLGAIAIRSRIWLSTGPISSR